MDYLTFQCIYPFFSDSFCSCRSCEKSPIYDILDRWLFPNSIFCDMINILRDIRITACMDPAVGILRLKRIQIVRYYS